MCIIADGDDCETNDCEDICTDGFYSFTCSCFPGFNITEDGKSCIGIANCFSFYKVAMYVYLMA